MIPSSPVLNRCPPALLPAQMCQDPPGLHPRGFSPDETVVPAPNRGDVPWARELEESFAFGPWEVMFPMGRAAPGPCENVVGQSRAGGGCSVLLQEVPMGCSSVGYLHLWIPGEPLALGEVPPQPHDSKGLPSTMTLTLSLSCCRTTWPGATAGDKGAGFSVSWGAVVLGVRAALCFQPCPPRPGNIKVPGAHQSQIMFS